MKRRSPVSCVAPGAVALASFTFLSNPTSLHSRASPLRAGSLSVGVACFAVPPHVLRSIAEKGTPEQRSKALATLTVDTTIRGVRSSSRRLTARTAPAPTPTPTLEGKLRTICDAKSRQELPGVCVRTEQGTATTDVAVEEAFTGLGTTYDFFDLEYGRSSLDDDGVPLDATVHFGQNYANAFWNGQRMVFGDGDLDLFNRFTICLDIIGHELGHGVIEDEAGLLYFNQTGALNESLADVCGSLVKQHHLKQTAAEADWLIGAGIFTSAVQGVAVRSMKDPGTAYNDPVIGKDPQPAHMENYVHTYEDNGGVHINSGIPNRAFYLAAVQIGGRAATGAGRVWYEALRDSQLRQNSGFARFAKLTVTHAARLLGTQGERAVRDAWAQVGIRT